MVERSVRTQLAGGGGFLGRKDKQHNCDAGATAGCVVAAVGFQVVLEVGADVVGTVASAEHGHQVASVGFSPSLLKRPTSSVSK